MKKFVLGIDGGGTYSRIIGICENGEVLGRFTGGSTNLASNSYETVKENIRILISNFLDHTNLTLDSCQAFCIGSAGIDIDEDVKKMEQLLKELELKCPIKVVNDIELILAAGTKGERGIAIISGTGSIGIAMDESGKSTRCGGWGYLIGDEGSGYYIGMQAIKCALASLDGRITHKTILSDKIIKHFGLSSIDEVLKIVYSEHFNKSKIAALAILVAEAAEENDSVAINIEIEAAKHLFAIADALIKQSNLYDCKIVLSGSVLLNNMRIREQFENMLNDLYENITIEPFAQKAEIGAVHLAQKLI